MPNGEVCSICGGAIPDGKQRKAHTALCAAVVSEELCKALADVARFRAKVKLAGVLLREVLSGADIRTSLAMHSAWWMRVAEEFTEDA